MAQLADIVAALDEELKTPQIPDYSTAMNGLQLMSEKPVNKIVAAVDASLPVVQKAVDLGADLLIVHHGMFWQGAQMITGGYYKKLKLAMDAGLAIYSSHIPLDVHPSMGNNAILAKKVGLKEVRSFKPWKGIELGLCGKFDGDLKDLALAVSAATGAPPHICQGDETGRVGTVGVVTGGAGGDVSAIFAEGIDTLVTGEGPHWSFTFAQEAGKSIIYGGHYATETFGVIALMNWIDGNYMTEGVFIDMPTGL